MLQIVGCSALLQPDGVQSNDQPYKLQWKQAAVTIPMCQSHALLEACNVLHVLPAMVFVPCRGSEAWHSAEAKLTAVAHSSRVLGNLSTSLLSYPLMDFPHVLALIWCLCCLLRPRSRQYPQRYALERLSCLTRPWHETKEG